jgi:hypothetical protein
MAALAETRARPGAALVACALAAAFVATRVALTWRFPWFVDETIFASFARDVHGDLGMLFVAESDKKGLLPSWLGAGLISTGIAPVTAMRLLAIAGAAGAAICGGYLMRRLYGTREGLLTAALVALGPYFLVTASVGIYDAMATGLVAAAVLVSLRLVRHPRPYTALLLGGILGAGGLTKPTAWVAVIVLPFTLLLFDYASPNVRRRLLTWMAHALLALALGYAISCIARMSPYYDDPITVANQRTIGDALGDLGPTLRANWPPLWAGLHGYLTLPGLLLAGAGAFVGARRRPGATAILGVWTLAVLTSALLLPLTEYPRYFATALVPLSGLVALGWLAAWDALAGGSWAGRNVRIAVAAAATLLAVLPAARFEARVLADPVHASYPGLDHVQYVTATSAQAWLEPVAREIERRGGPYPVQIDFGSAYPWGLDLRLNGTAVGAQRRYHLFGDGQPAQLRSARYAITDGAAGDAPPRPGFRLIRRIARTDGGAVLRLYERS